MLAVTAEHVNDREPLAALGIGQRPDPTPLAGWTTVSVRAASLNHHDLWALRGVGVPPGRLPLVLGSEAAGVDEDGNEVLVYPVIADPAAGRSNEDGTDGADHTVAENLTAMLSVDYDGGLAERVAVPRRNLLPKPPELSFVEAACLAGAYLSAYRMLFEKSGAQPGSTVLVQGAGGGVATALVVLGAATGYRMWVTSRSADKRAKATAIGADRAFAPGARLPERVDAVMETVGAATWDHSVKVLRPGGRIVVAGATSGAAPATDLRTVFYRQLSVVGSTLGTLAQLGRLLRLCVVAGVRPVVDSVLPLASARDGFAALAAGDVFGKVVLVP